MGKIGVTREGEPSAFEQYDGLIADLWREGHSLRSIGRVIDRTGERVRQILDKHYPNIVVSVITEAKLAQLIGVSPDKLEGLRQKGILHPKILRANSYLYNAEGVLEAFLACQKFCKLCCKEMPVKGARRYCDGCTIKIRKNPWLVRTLEGKKKCVEATHLWALRNPERYRTIQAKAIGKYQEKQRAEHFAETEYIVIRRNDVLPVGTVFKAVGGIGHWGLELEDGTTVPINCARIKRFVEVCNGRTNKEVTRD